MLRCGVGQANDCNHWVDLYTATLTPACVLMCCRDQHSCSTTTTTSSRCRMLWPTWRSIPHSWSKAKGVICALFYVLEVIGKSDYDTSSLSSLIKKKGVCESRPSESYFLTFTFSLSWRMHCSKPQHCSTLTYSIQFFLLLLWTQFYQTELTTSVERQLFTLSNMCVDQQNSLQVVQDKWSDEDPDLHKAPAKKLNKGRWECPRGEQGEQPDMAGITANINNK